MRRILAVAAVLCLAVAAFAAPALAGGTDLVKPPEIFKAKIPKVKAQAGLDVYLPSNLRVFTSARRVRGTARAGDGRYDLQLGIGRNCGGANACYLANFAAIRGEEPGLGRKVGLANGHTGHWKGITCGASCSPAEIQWVEDGVLYSIATKGVSVKKEKATLAKLANSAINAGPR